MRLQPVFTFSSEIKRGTAWLTETDGSYSGITVHCGVCRTMGLMPLPIGVVPHVGIQVCKPGSVDDVGWIGIYLMSRKARLAIQRAGLKGAAFRKPFEIECDGDGPRYASTVRDIKSMDLKVMYVTGSGGWIARSNRVRLIRSCKYCGWREWTQPRGKIKVDGTQWDGSDFFRVHEYAPILMTERAAAVLQAANVSSFKPEYAGDIVHRR